MRLICHVISFTVQWLVDRKKIVLNWLKPLTFIFIDYYLIYLNLFDLFSLFSLFHLNCYYWLLNWFKCLFIYLIIIICYYLIFIVINWFKTLLIIFIDWSMLALDYYYFIWIWIIDLFTWLLFLFDLLIFNCNYWLYWCNCVFVHRLHYLTQILKNNIEKHWFNSN